MYIGGLDRYVERCDRIVSDGYVGFNFTAGEAGRVAPIGVNALTGAA
jgi:hypothetical protein